MRIDGSGLSSCVVPGFSIAQVTPFPWEDDHEVNAFVAELSGRLAERGHRVLVLAPSRSPELVRDSRRLIRAARENPEALFAPDGEVRVLGVGELLPFNRRREPSPPVDIGRTIEEALALAPLDFVHVHEPFAPSASSVALRHSRALNVGSFHVPSERVLSTQVARRFVELFFGRLDVRTASFEATRELMEHFFPAPYRMLRPGATVAERGEPGSGAAADRLRRPRGARGAAACSCARCGGCPTTSSGRRRSTRPPARRPPARCAAACATASRSSRPARRTCSRAPTSRSPPRSARRPPRGCCCACWAPGPSRWPPGCARTRRSSSPTTSACASSPATSRSSPPTSKRLARDRDQLAKLRAGVDGARGRLSWDRVTDEAEAIYEELAARRRPEEGDDELRAKLRRRPLIDVDLHMHTDHSGDCVTPVDVLLSTARERGLGAIAVTDHNEISGALDARSKAAEYGVKVIVGEEVKTADQGEVIGLFIEEKIPRGMTLEETIAEIKRQGGLVYVPHPFDRLHSVPDYEHLLAVVDDLDAIEVFNPRIAIPAFNEEAVRFAGKYRIVGGAGSDAHVAQGLGEVRIRMRDFDGPEEFLESLRDADITGRPSSLYYAQVQALKFLQTRATPAGARRANRRRQVKRAVAGREGS